MGSVPQLTPRTLQVLQAIGADRRFPVTVRELCDELGVSSTSSVHRHIDKLADLGLIERCGNRRAVTLLGRSVLTPAGQIALNRRAGVYVA